MIDLRHVNRYGLLSLFAVVILGQIAWSQSTAAGDMSLAVASPRTSDEKRWTIEKQILSGIVDRIEANLSQMYARKWKLKERQVVKPPEWSAQHCSARLTGNPATEISISLMDSDEQAAGSYHLNNQMLASGKAVPVSQLGDEAVSILGGYSIGGQIRVMRGRFLVVVYARTPAEATRIARFIDGDIESVIPALSKVE